MELAREHIYAIINPKWFEKGYVEFDFTNEICLTKNYTRNLIKKAEARLGVGKYAEDRIIYNNDHTCHSKAEERHEPAKHGYRENG